MYVEPKNPILKYVQFQFPHIYRTCHHLDISDRMFGSSTLRGATQGFLQQFTTHLHKVQPIGAAGLLSADLSRDPIDEDGVDTLRNCSSHVREKVTFGTLNSHCNFAIDHACCWNESSFYLQGARFETGA